jgi:hypothetical protein
MHRLLKHKGESLEEKAYPEWGSAPSVTDALLKEKGKEAFREEGGSDSQPNQPRTEAAKRVERYISAEPFVLANPPSPDACSEAIKAELREVGSGLAVVRKAANDTWKRRRSSA